MKTNHLDRYVWGVLLVVLLLVLVILWRGDRVGAQISATYPAEGDELSAWGWVGITFTQPMQTTSVEERFSLEPDIDGHFNWQENTLWFIPDQPFASSQAYRVQLSAGALSVEGRSVKDALQFEFRIRSPQVIYLSNQPGNYDLFVDDLAGNIRQLTHSGGRVYDYSVFRDGETILYSRQNDRNGVDLWLIRRDGSDEHLLLDCGSDVCSEAAVSPDGSMALYTRQASLATAPLIWSIDLENEVNEQLFDGSQACWSPDGRYLAALDQAAGTIRVIDIQTKKGIELETGWDTSPVWFPDSTRLLYADMQAGSSLPYPILYQVDMTTDHVSAFLEENLAGMEFSMPAISPDGELLVIALRTVRGELTKQLWLVKLDGSGERAITLDKTFSSHGYQWDVNGERLLFQQVQLQDPGIFSRIMVWNRENGKLLQVARDVALPNWLP